eukprot:s224_g20.t1
MPEAEAPEAEADEGRLSTSSRSLRRSKSFSKRRAIRGLWQSLRELGSHVETASEANISRASKAAKLLQSRGLLASRRPFFALPEFDGTRQGLEKREWWQAAWQDEAETLKGNVRRWRARDPSSSDSGERLDAAVAVARDVEAEGLRPPPSVQQALTVQGSQQGQAMITGRKQVENRSWRIPAGWYALHVGARPLAALGDEWVRRLARSWPDAPAEKSLPSACIVGFIHISEHRRPEQCGGCQSLWAVGPICHIIDEAL